MYRVHTVFIYLYSSVCVSMGPYVTDGCDLYGDIMVSLVVLFICGYVQMGGFHIAWRGFLQAVVRPVSRPLVGGGSWHFSHFYIAACDEISYKISSQLMTFTLSEPTSLVFPKRYISITCDRRNLRTQTQYFSRDLQIPLSPHPGHPFLQLLTIIYLRLRNQPTQPFSPWKPDGSLLPQS